MSEEPQQNFNIADGPIYLPDDATQSGSNPMRRIILGGGILIWFLVLLLPIFFFILAANGEIVIWHGNVPERESHPLLRIDLISEIDYRGFGITRSVIRPGTSDLEVCMQTQIGYLLWEGEGTPAVYCDCYKRANVDESWEFTETITDVCPQ